ncbi:hypothetical protein TorRG33x02_143630 [Trema orientale]|uniref:Uncharacterized protein n=1 Tax=Trema orientale TaxID=63057 RepID=A0A2P5EWD4_TREOI|nr:hypothetical protein TorRG33x02_143630 [Trema orientale]
MALKSNKINRITCLHAPLGLFICACAVLSSPNQGFLMNLKGQLRGHGTHCSVQSIGNVARSIQDGLVTLGIKFLHFFVSRCLQFKYLSPIQPPPFSSSWLFWVTFTRSGSSMPDLPL